MRDVLRGETKVPPRPGEQQRWIEALDDIWWLDRWGMTPSQVDELSAESYLRIRSIAELQDELAAERIREQKSRERSSET